MNALKKLSLTALSLCLINSSQADTFLGQGTMSGEVTATSAILQTRLTAATEINDKGDLPGAAGDVCFEWCATDDFKDAKRTPIQKASAENDFIVRDQLSDLQSHTCYYYRAIYADKTGPTCSFQTLLTADSSEPVQFIVGSCMNYCKFMYGKAAQSSGPVTATDEDKRLGYPAFATMQALNPQFFVGTGDIVYYDNKIRMAKTVEQLRGCWHEQFRFPRLISFFQNVPTYWSKDDHDFRFNDSDNASDKLPLPKTGIDIFREQLPIGEKTYRTIRVNKDLQLWLTEGRDFRSPNKMEDGPDKTLWGAEQREWLQSTLKASDAKWKILITPTPMVGPDDAYKKDNHANLSGFRHEANAFFDWLKENKIENFMTVCGDRHWQYHSIHPSGVEEFACGALNDENSRNGVKPGSKKGTDPEALIKQPYTSPEPSGGFLHITADKELTFKFHNDQGKVLYTVKK
jgi:alkaline phosphatase D